MGHTTATTEIEIKCTKASDFVPELNRPYVVKNLLWPGEVGMIAGAPGLGKTTIVAALAAHASQGRNFGGLSVRNTLVIYYAAEDPNGVLRRAYPYTSEPAFDTAPFYVVHDAPNLMNPTHVANITAFCAAKKRQHNADRVLVIFDTLNRCIGEADENSSSAMGTVVSNAGRIARATNASVLFVHHVGNGGSDRPRGSSAFEGNVDPLCILKKAPDTGNRKVVFLAAKKQKNAEEIGPIPFELASYHVGFDDDGDAVTFPMARAMEPKVAAKVRAAANANEKPKKASDSKEARKTDVLRLLKEIAAADPRRAASAVTIGATCGAAFNGDRENPDSLRKAVKRALDALVEEGDIECSPRGYRAFPDDVSGQLEGRVQEGDD